MTTLPRHQRLKRWFSLVLWGFFFSSLAGADDPSPITRLVRGDGEVNAILPILSQTVRQNPDDGSGWAWLGYAHCLQGDWQAAEQAYARARSLAAPFNLAWLPPQLPVDWAVNWRGIGRGRLAGKRLWWSPPTPTQPVTFSLPDRPFVFPWLIAVYADEGQVARQWVRWLMVSEQMPDTLKTAPFVFAWSLREFAITFGTTPKLPVTVWLLPEGDGHAETVFGNTRFFGFVPFDRWRWWLKVAHEAGHHTIPAFGPFDGLHEPYSGGFLGERLFALWLWDAQGDSPMDIDLSRGLRSFLRSTVIPEIVAGQQMLLRAPDDPPSMPTFLGICAYLERVAGRTFLRSVMEQAGGDHWKAFQRGVQRAITTALKGEGLTLRLAVPDANTAPTEFDPQGLRLVPRRSATQLAWWLPSGAVQGQLQVQGSGELVMRWGDHEVGRWHLAPSPPTFHPPLPIRWTVTQPGWQRLRLWWVQGEGQVVSLALQNPKEGAR